MLLACSRHSSKHVDLSSSRSASRRWLCAVPRSRAGHSIQSPSATRCRPIARLLPDLDRNVLGARHFSPAAAEVKDVAILGGGITGLATAWYLTQEFPDAKVTIYDRQPSVGGWMQSKIVDVGDGEVIFEQGPRSLRPQPPNGTLALRLAQALDLENELLVTYGDAPAAQNRFIYYPDHLVRMPGPGLTLWENLWNVATEPVFKNIFRGIWNELNTDPRAKEVEDESIGEWVSRRFHKDMANNLVSAMFHGIYAGDVWQLSAKTILARQWHDEVRFGNMAQAGWEAMRHRQSWSFCDDVELQMELQEGGWSETMREKMSNCSVWTFQKGIGSFVERLRHRLAHKNNVTFQLSTDIAGISKANDSRAIQLESTPANGDESARHKATHSHVISTIGTEPLVDSILSASRDATNTDDGALQKVQILRETRAVDVAVVNLYFSTPQLLQKVTPPGGVPNYLRDGLQGFGYLIPQTVPYEQNLERALGVIFDSDISPELWTSVPPERRGTRLTVMLGGHWWDGWSELPSVSECEEMAVSILARHLGITERPAAINAVMQRNCIPQFTVGHMERMAVAHEGLASLFGGRVKVAGSWYTGNGVNNCLRSAFDVVRAMKKSNVVESTGLEQFSRGRPMALVRRTGQGEVSIIKMDDEGHRQGFFQKLPRRSD